MALSEAEKEEIRELHERGLNLAEIARVTDRHWQTVQKYLVNAGLLTRGNSLHITGELPTQRGDSLHNVCRERG